MTTAQYAKIGGIMVLVMFVCAIPQGYAESPVKEADFQRMGSKYGVSPYLLLAVSIVESQNGELLGKYEVSKVVDNTQLAYLKKIARHTGRDVSEFKGSAAGAMGFMQIMPSTFHTYAQDGDGDGIKDPLNPHDSLATAAYYLARTIALKKNVRNALKSYNNSVEYCESVVKLSQKLELETTFASRK
ncbi:lytic murein transglycosylase [Candidatus Moduliflexus flocculans]|uniref:Lytic murein transglycosylase n=1 Tax=Candidatus Moduliflexus flocculans TaxID=1499966 RepID=A0A081BPY7_9BACT|nr:lytic murein transglycosylase [Candidatus Moduliflexus flocculans]